jgi:hypothetical protein
VNQNPTQVLHGRLFGLRQSKATQWIHVLLPILRDALRTLGDAPYRHVEVLRARLEVEEPPQALEASAAEAAHAATPPAAPLFVMMALSNPSRSVRVSTLMRCRIYAAWLSNASGGLYGWRDVARK